MSTPPSFMGYKLRYVRRCTPKNSGYTAHLFHPGSNQRFGPENPAGFHPKTFRISSLTIFLIAIAK